MPSGSSALWPASKNAKQPEGNRLRASLMPIATTVGNAVPSVPPPKAAVRALQKICPSRSNFLTERRGRRSLRLSITPPKNQNHHLTPGRALLLDCHPAQSLSLELGPALPVGRFYSTATQHNPPIPNCHRHPRSGGFTRVPTSTIHQSRIVTGTASRAVLLEYHPAQCIDTSLSPGTAGFLKILKKCAICRKLCYNGENERRSR